MTSPAGEKRPVDEKPAPVIPAQSSFFPDHGEIMISDREFELMRQVVRSRTGIHLTDNKRMLVEGRLRKILNLRNISNFQKYMELLESDTTGEALTEFIGRITTNYTFFHRETDHYNFLNGVILPRFAAPGADIFRIWSAGCATGPETYDIAMHIHEYMSGRSAPPSAIILGTDISRKAIDAANRGIYREESLKNVPPRRIEAYFSKQSDGRYSVADCLRKLVMFRVLNLLRDTYPFQHKFHAIFCRNVLIYFDEETRLRLVRRLHDCLVPGGFLLLGHSESLLSRQTEFKSEGSSVYSRRM